MVLMDNKQSLKPAKNAFDTAYIQQVTKANGFKFRRAAEALDIKTLSTLVMATPKKDVKQAVGRIFRSKGNKLVIDIVDQHDIFKNHWTQRRRWYNRQEFNIMYTTNERYEKDEWDKIPHKKTKAIKVKTEPYETLYTGKCLISN